MNDITKALVYLNDQDLRNRRIREKRILILQIICSLVFGLIIARVAWVILITPYLEGRERAELQTSRSGSVQQLAPVLEQHRSDPHRSSVRQLGYDPYALPTDLGEPDHARKHH